jgi:peptide/nickel transport system permease protein
VSSQTAIVGRPRVAPLPSQRRRAGRLWRLLGANRLALLGAVLALLVLAAALGAPLITPLDPFDQSAAQRLDGPDALHILGRDTFGRDVFARLLYAGRVSLLVGGGAVALGGTLGTLLGLVAGAMGGWLGRSLMRSVDVLMAFPSLLLGLAILTVLGAGLDRLIVAIGLVLAPPFARVVHATTLSLARRDFVEAARSLGAGWGRILLRHLLPNLLDEVIVLAGLLVATAIRIEASLSFVGLGVAPPAPTWGNMIRDGAPVLLRAPWLSVAPGLAILLTVLACNLLADGARDVLDPRVH